MNRALLLQLCLYEILDIVPCAILTVAPFQGHLRSRWVFYSCVAALYLIGIARRWIAYEITVVAGILSVVWIFVYVYIVLCKVVIQASLPKLLFVLITVLNYASFIAIVYSYLGFRFFAVQIQAFPYCWQVSGIIIALFATTAPWLYYLMVHWVAPLISAEENSHIWELLWLVPATFCVFFYYNLHMNSNILTFSRNLNNLVFVVTIYAGSFFVLYLILRLVEENRTALRLKLERKQLEMQILQYENLQKKIEETRRARHDLRQCMTVIQSYLQNGDRGELKRFAANFCKTLPTDAPIFYCHHPAINAVIAFYAGIAAQEQILFDMEVQLPRGTWIEDIDLVVLFGNLLENAVEACIRQVQGERFVRLRTRIESNTVIFALDNSFSGEVIAEGTGFRSAKRSGVGLGIQSVRRIVEKYQGVVSFQQRRGVFCVSMLLHQPSRQGVSIHG